MFLSSWAWRPCGAEQLVDTEFSRFLFTENSCWNQSWKHAATMVFLQDCWLSTVGSHCEQQDGLSAAAFILDQDTCICSALQPTDPLSHDGPSFPAALYTTSLRQMRAWDKVAAVYRHKQRGSAAFGKNWNQTLWRDCIIILLNIWDFFLM